MRTLLRSVTLVLALCVTGDAADAAPRSARSGAAIGKAGATAGKPLKIAPTRKVVVGAAVAPRQTRSASKADKAKSARRDFRSKSARATGWGHRRQPSVAAVVDAGLVLTAMQRGAIYQAIAQAPLQPKAVLTERVPRATNGLALPGQSADSGPPPSAVAEPEPVLGSLVPDSIPLLDLPPAAVEAVPEVAAYRYAFVGDRVLLVDPGNGVVVAALLP